MRRSKQAIKRSRRAYRPEEPKFWPSGWNLNLESFSCVFHPVVVVVVVVGTDRLTTAPRLCMCWVQKRSRVYTRAQDFARNKGKCIRLPRCCSLRG